MEKSLMRLHGSTMYIDTIAVIKEMLHEESMDGKFDDIFNKGNYFPESFLSVDRISRKYFLYNETYAERITISKENCQDNF